VPQHQRLADKRKVAVHDSHTQIRSRIH
jgi:hypothetical protein